MNDELTSGYLQLVNWLRKARSMGLPSWIRFGHDSSSRIGQYVHDNMPTTFYWSDIDGECYKKSTRIYRIFEEKKAGQRAKGSQRFFLREHAWAIEKGVKEGRYAEGSGVFLIEVLDIEEYFKLTHGFKYKIFQIFQDGHLEAVEVGVINHFLGCYM